MSRVFYSMYFVALTDSIGFYLPVLDYKVESRSIKEARACLCKVTDMLM